jgi:predicted HAD superfamily Cof-like phosphohydrolase
MSDYNFAGDIRRFNEMYGLSRPENPSLLPPERMEQFKSILMEEVGEIDDILKKYRDYESRPGGITREQRVEVMTELADWIGDIMVYTRSEAQRYGIPLEDVLRIIMQSNFSKLGADGKPIYDERKKVMKGPNYWKPEPKISDLLKGLMD